MYIRSWSEHMTHYGKMMSATLMAQHIYCTQITRQGQDMVAAITMHNVVSV